MPLSRRQEHLYTHTCSIFRTLRAIAGSGKPGEEGLEQVNVDVNGATLPVPCYYQYNPNVDDVSEAGRILRSTLFTTDVLHLSYEQEIADGWWVLNTTLDEDGTPAPNFGQVHKVLGAPQILPGTRRRPTRKQMVMIMPDEHPPEELL